MANQTKCDYSKGIIYKIKCLDRNIKDIYVGSTTNFVSRKTQHKNTCNNPNNRDYNYFVYEFIREHGGWDNWTMIPIKKYPCNSHMELVIEEQSVIEELEEYTTLNRRKAWRSEEQRKEDNKKNKIKNKDKIKEYREKNKEHITKQRKEHYQKNKDTLQKYQKNYYEKNRHKIVERVKEYYGKHIDTISERKKEKVSCECGSKVRKDGLSEHCKSIKHMTWEQQPEPNLIFVD